MIKKLIFIIAFLILTINITEAQSITPNTVISVINNGNITTSFIEKYKDTCNVKISATGESNNYYIYYSFECINEDEKGNKTSEVYADTVLMTYDEEENMLVSERTIEEDDLDLDPYYKEIVRLIPFWGVESSSKYDEIMELYNKLYDATTPFLNLLSTIFDRCYMAEMGVCYMSVESYGDVTYTGRILLDDTAGEYALSYLKDVQKEENFKKVTVMGVIIAIFLLILILICKSIANNTTTSQKNNYFS